MTAAYILGMRTNTIDQPRGDAVNKGHFATKSNSEPEAPLTAPPAQTSGVFAETQRRLRGHDFYPRDISTWPPLYANENVPLAEQQFVAHYFVGAADWYISEVDQATGEAFGWADLGFGEGEFGYIQLEELEQLRVSPSGFPQVVERELMFKRGTRAKEVIEKYKESA